MSDIEHWTIHWTSPDKDHNDVAMSGVSGPFVKLGEPVDVVPAANLEGAVDLLAAILEAREKNATRTHKEYETELQKRCYEVAEAFLANTGGRYESD